MMETRQHAATRTSTLNNVDLGLLLYMEYAYENIGFIPKWLNITMY